MRAIIKTEFLKIKRYHIIWAGVGLMLLSVLLTLFTSTANDGSVWTFSYLAEQVIKNNMYHFDCRLFGFKRANRRYTEKSFNYSGFSKKTYGWKTGGVWSIIDSVGISKRHFYDHC